MGLRVPPAFYDTSLASPGRKWWGLTSHAATQTEYIHGVHKRGIYIYMHILICIYVYIYIYIYIYCEFHSSSCLFASCQVHISHVLAVQAQDPSGGREWNQTIALCRWARHRCGRISWSIYFHQEVDIPFRVRGPIKQSKGIGRIGFLLPV